MKNEQFYEPDKIEQSIREFHQFKLSLDDDELDAILGIESKKKEKIIDKSTLANKYGVEQYIYEGTPYAYIRYIIHRLSPKKHENIYDLGSGYGRFVLYGALTTLANFQGVEIVEERVSTAQSVIDRLNLSNASLIRGNVTEINLSDGDIYFLFNPFFRETLEIIGQRLSRITYKKIRIVTWGGASNDFFGEQRWLKLLGSTDSAFYKIQFFESRFRDVS